MGLLWSKTCKLAWANKIQLNPFKMYKLKQTFHKQTQIEFLISILNHQELALMYWGKSLDQCTDQFCTTSWTFSLPFTKNTPQKPENNPIRIQNPKNSLKANDCEKDKFSEKRSLKKSQNNLKSQTSYSVNTSSVFFPQTRNSTEVLLSKKTSIKNFSQKEPIFPGTFKNKLLNDTNVRYEVHKNQEALHIQTEPTQRVWSNYNKTKDRPVLRFSNNLPVQQSLQTKKFTHTRNSFKEDMSSFVNSNSYGQQNSFRRQSYERLENMKMVPFISTNGRNYSNLKIRKQNITIFDPRQANFQTVRYHNGYQNNVVPCIQLNSPRGIYYPNNNQRYTPVQSIQNLVNEQTHRYPPNQFPTIREQNSTYEQSKSIMDCSNGRQFNSIAFYQLEQKNQQVPILSSINNSVQQEQEKNQETFYNVIRNKEPEFQPGLDRSDIEAENKVPQFDLSCELLLLESQKTNKVQEKLENLRIYEQIKRSYEQQEMNVQIQRRQMLQPSICLRVIENKLRDTSYQMSQTSSQGIQSQFKSSNPLQSQEQAIPSFPSPQNIVSPRKGYQAMSIRSPCKVKMLKNSVRFNLDNKSSFMEDKQNNCEHNSPIKILDSDKELNIHSLATFSKEKQKQDKNEVHLGLLKEVNFNELRSDNDPQPSIRKLCINNKKVKSLIQQKMSTDSIFEDSSSFGKHQCSNQLITKYMLDDNFNLDGILSNQNVDREESTVIDRYTFDSRLEKLP